MITKQIKEIKFSLLSPEQIKKISAKKIVTPELYDMDGYPVDGGLMDLHLGVIAPGIRCRTCGGTVKECHGHFGHIELARPVLHIKFLPLIEHCLRHTCKECGRLMLKDEKEPLEKAKTAKKCPFCGSTKEKISLEKPSTFFYGKKRLFPTEIREWLQRIPDEDCKKLGIAPDGCRPEWAVLTLLLVPSVIARPSITLETGERSEDDLTHKLSDIVRSNQRLWENLNAGAPEVIIEDLWDLLQYHVTTYFDNTIAQLPPARHRGGYPLRTVTERIKGKEGRIRHNLAGKRVNFSARAVISPDPYIELNEVGVPQEVASLLTIPERVTLDNTEHLKKFITAQTYPQAVSVVRPDGKRKHITDELKEQLIEELQPGYLVERQLQEGDILLFNRHPSLHRMSMMGHFARILPGRTLRLHPGICFPYNADFDGDEMNIHAPQTEEAKAEAQILLNAVQHLMSPKVNVNVFGCVEDAVTGLYLLTKNPALEKAEAAQLLALAGSKLDFKLKEKVSGKEVFSALLPKINFKCKTKDGSDFVIKDGKLVEGFVDNQIIGVETNTLVRELDKQVGRTRTIQFLKQAFLLGIIYLTKFGFSLSLRDLELPEEVTKGTEAIIKRTEAKSEEILEAYSKNELEVLPGKSVEETREIKLLQLLNDVRPKASELLQTFISKENPIYVMTACGSRGSLLFITQMVCAVGQQALWARRIGFGYQDRTLSFYKTNDLGPRARGFIYSNYLKGLKPDEFFFTAITGRDGLMDTALRTPKSGYLYRRLLNALQDVRIEYDGTVRDSNFNIIQFKYGVDGIDVCKEHLKGKITPGEAIGVVTAESFGEPATQMTLNVFHFAGISEMAVTLGLPRLIEIFDAKKKPSTPSMEIYLKKNTQEEAKKLALKIKEVKLGELIKEIQLDFSASKITLTLDQATMKELKIKTEQVEKALTSKHVKVKRIGHELQIKTKDQDFKALYRLKEKIKDFHVSGIKGITQVLPTKRGPDYVILTAGSNLAEVLKLPEVDEKRTITNDIHEIAQVLGVEAARAAIVEEATKVIKKQGLEIDRRHIELVADAMTTSGEVKGCTRTGIISDKESILARASFETPIRHFVNAAITGSKDHLVSVIENLILNQPIPVGTGLPGLLVKITEPARLARKA